MRLVARGCAIVAAVAWHAMAAAQVNAEGCGSLKNAYGPLDYRTDRGPPLQIVEDYHFTPDVESLVHGRTGLVGGDIAYTLRAYPNHHRALVAMMRLGQRLKTQMPEGAGYTVECFFDRAIRFAPDDAIVRNLYAIFLYDNARKPEAVAQLRQASILAKDDAYTHYNIGLIYAQHGDLDGALPEVQRAMQLGFPRDDLKKKLEAAGKWVEPPPLPASAPDSAASEPATAAASAAS
jgi:tetratricopeptide (TPR) repeat protein